MRVSSGRLLLFDDVLGWQRVFLAGLRVLQLGGVEVLDAVQEFVFLLLRLDSCSDFTAKLRLQIFWCDCTL